MDLIKVQDDFINLIKNNYNEKYILTTDYIDLDSYKNDFTIFVEFENIEPKDNLSDDCRQYGKLNLQIYLVMRNDTSQNLRSKLLKATSDVYKILFDNDIEVKNIEFYNYVTGTKYIVASEFNLTLEININ